MNYIFVFSIGIFIGIISAFEIFQKQLKKEIHHRKVIRYLRQLNVYYNR